MSGSQPALGRWRQTYWMLKASISLQSEARSCGMPPLPQSQQNDFRGSMWLGSVPLFSIWVTGVRRACCLECGVTTHTLSHWAWCPRLETVSQHKSKEMLCFKQGLSMESLLSSNLLGRPSWPQGHRSSYLTMLGLKAFTTTASTGCFKYTR